MAGISRLAKSFYWLDCWIPKWTFNVFYVFISLGKEDFRVWSPKALNTNPALTYSQACVTWDYSTHSTKIFWPPATGQQYFGDKYEIVLIPPRVHGWMRGPMRGEEITAAFWRLCPYRLESIFHRLSKYCFKMNASLSHLPAQSPSMELLYAQDRKPPSSGRPLAALPRASWATPSHHGGLWGLLASASQVVEPGPDWCARRQNWACAT